METLVQVSNTAQSQEEEEEEPELRRGPWTMEEDQLLMNYIALHGEGRWNSLARRAGLKRTGKSCRLRWLNYLNPDVRRGNITPQEQLLILELHSLWGNRWSKIAQHLPGRTDNEIKNYWRTRVQKHAKQLQCDANSQEFEDTVRYVWIPRLIERIQEAGDGALALRENSDHTADHNSYQASSAASTTFHEFEPNSMLQSYTGTPSQSTQISAISDALHPGGFHDFPQMGSSATNQVGPSGYSGEDWYPELAAQLGTWAAPNYGSRFGDSLWSSEEEGWIWQQQLCNSN